MQPTNALHSSAPLPESSDSNERSLDFEALAVNGAPECAHCGAEDGNYTFDRTTKRLICSSCAPHRFPRAPTPTSDRWTFPFSISGVCDNPVHRVMVNWYPLIPAGWEAGPNHHGHYGTGFAVFSCTQQPKNLHLKPVYFLQYLSIQDISLQSQSQ